MTLRALPVLATIATIALVGTAIAADMTGAEIKELVSGKTVYLDLGAGATAGAGKGAIYYAADGTA